MGKNPIIKYLLGNHILSTVLIVGLALFLFEIKSILAALFTSYIIMASLNPFVEYLRKYKVPKIIASAVVFAVVLAFIILLVIPILPFFIIQMQNFIEQAPKYINQASKSLGIQLDGNDLNSFAVPVVNFVSSNALGITSKVFGGIFSILTIFILGFYLLLDKNKLEKSFLGNFSNEKQIKIANTIKMVEEKLGAWLRGQIILSFTIGLITWLLLTFLNIEFALPLAILAGFLEIVPTLGPIIAAIPAVIVALAISPVMAGLIVISYMLIQLLENNFLVPKIMEKSVGLNPVIIIVAILIGGNLMGVIGALLSIPFVSALIIIFKSTNKN